ncbi:SAM-dependent methyltransferase [Parashewanella curva]|uniref:SAM-dependent methyltransferase n=1 Tax=Parashewanella curva TaxID=2338552 RepID=A0A3L8PYP1_9GAMM|nr:nucleoside triphosphate pyrophosphohydrolase family protein [Parashewanella curva]RLV60464.1 SAM-dependent methyltransferase [Parashewanella curva]
MQLPHLSEPLYQQLYRDISQFRSTFDLPVEAPDTLNEQSDTLHSSLIIEELTELAQADSLVEQADAIVDSVYVLMGRLVHLGIKHPNDSLEISYFIDVLLATATNLNIDFLKCWNEVHSSNMSKVCQSEEEYQATVSFYAKQGISLTATHQGNYIIAKCAEDTLIDGKMIRQGKVLKNVYYRAANLLACI